MNLDLSLSPRYKIIPPKIEKNTFQTPLNNKQTFRMKQITWLDIIFLKKT